MPPEETNAPETHEPAPEPQAEPVPAPVAQQPEPAPLESSQTPSESSPPEVLAPEPTPETLPEPTTAQMGRNEPIQSVPEPIVPAPVAVRHSVRDILAKASAMIQFRKTKKLEKIMVAINQHGKITNDEVEKLLHVSDATATRYLSALEKQGKIKQVGKTGTGVVYSKI